VPTDERYPPLALSPALRKSRTLDALVARILAFADGRPLLLVLEDAQYVDSTTAELFERIVIRAPESPCLVIVTARTGYSPPWEGEAHVRTIRLDRLGPRQCRAVAERLAGEAGLGDDVLGAIVARADGVPLFVEELTRAVLDAGVGRVEDAGGPEIPATLKDALMARLDRLGPAKRVAQTGAVIGREFDFELIAEVTTLDEDALGRALERLRRADLVFQPGMPFLATYVFKQGLVYETAYGSVLKRSRQDLHGRIAGAIESRFHDIAQSQPEMVARHYTAAGRFSNALPHWVKAVEASVRRWPCTRPWRCRAAGSGQSRILNRGLNGREPNWRFAPSCSFRCGRRAVLPTPRSRRTAPGATRFAARLPIARRFYRYSMVCSRFHGPRETWPKAAQARNGLRSGRMRRARKRHASSPTTQAE
ncbi:MAG: hypothetical protein QGG17_05915, partial [Rhodospirillales bacterium]|nr:hypothetical protein [Rhodospirillales bacterium]